MINEEIRKLLGGYATNTLTESERKALFEAALDDQELFNLLQQEQPFKDLLSDPASRTHIRQALEQPSPKPQSAWWARWWTWTGAASAVAAAAIAFVVIRSNETRPVERPAQIASANAGVSNAGANEPARGPAAEQPPARAAETEQKRKLTARPADSLTARRSEQQPQEQAASGGTTVSGPAETKIVGSLNSPAPAPPEAKQSGQALSERDQQSRIQAPAAMNSFRQALASPSVAPQANAQLGAVAAGAVNSYIGPLLHYSLLKRDANGTDVPLAQADDLKPGELVRLSVSAGVPGYLALYQLDATGQWNRVSGTTVEADSTIILPDSFIQIQRVAERFRLALLRIAPQSQNAAGIGGGGGGRKDAARAELGTGAAPYAPLVIELTLVGK
jgi:hypothetical protein